MPKGRIVSLGRLLPRPRRPDRLAIPARTRLLDAGDRCGRLLAGRGAGAGPRGRTRWGILPWRSVFATWRGMFAPRGVAAVIGNMAAAAGLAWAHVRGGDRER